MISKRFNLIIFFKLLVFFFTSVGLVYFLLVKPNHYLLILFVVILVIEIIQFIHYFNAINRKLAYFFDAIRNEDTTLKFPENVKNKSLRNLHSSLNNLNKLISDIKIKNETNERFFRELIEHSSTGLMSVDPDGYIEIMNRAAKRFLGISYLSNIRLLQQKNPIIYDAISSIKPREKLILKLVVKQELINLSLQSSELRFNEKSYKLISLQDIRHELEENEIDSWQKLIRVMTHEIMNSIAPITSLTNTLSRFYRSGEIQKAPEDLTINDIKYTIEGLAVIEDRGKGLMHFVDNYRQLTKVPQPVFSPLDLNIWAHSFELLFHSEFFEKNIHFDLKLEHKSLLVTTDEKLLNQVMINLMSNAIDAVSQNDQKKIALSIFLTSCGTVKIELSDNGYGIDESLMDKIFVPFFTTKEGGNGIGLSLSRQIVRKLNGKLTAQSAVGQGSRFALEL
jgi:two-component system, NtrC family, nitrogen regulation sensor histidine kinase NtrY